MRKMNLFGLAARYESVSPSETGPPAILVPMRVMVLLLAITTAPPSGAQTAGPLRDYVALARTAPPEFTADALLRLAAGPLAPPAKRIALLDEAFETAASATWKIRLTPAINNLHTDSRDGMLYDAMALELDALSLQCRVVRAVLPLNAARARELFTRIPPPRVPAYSCKDPLVARPDIYYQVAGELVKGAFTAEERRKGEDLRFIETLARTATSVVQLEPVAELIQAASTNSEGYSNLVSAFASALGAVDVSDRAFRLPFGLNQRIWDMVAQCRKHEISLDALAQAWRATLVRHFGGVRCADNFLRGRVPNATGAAADPLARTLDFPRLAPISDEEAKPLKIVDEMPEQHDYWQTAPARSAAATLRSLRASPDKGAGVLTLVQELDAWRPDAEASPIDHFQQVGMVYAELIPMAPAGTIRDQVIARYVAFLLASAIQRESPVEWYQAAATVARRSADAGERVWQEYESSGNPILLLYARLRKMPH